MNDIDLGPDLRLHFPLDTYKREDFSVLRHVLNKILNNGTNGAAVEFGVATGETLAMIAKVLPVIGFDSFEGLPEDWREDFPAGFFKGVMPSSPIPNSTIVTGWFEDTAIGYDFPQPLALVHIDCDLYSSTVTALEAITDAVDVDTYIVFDEFFGYPGSKNHEKKAFREWIENYGFTYEVIGHGREQWACRLTGVSA